MLDLVPFAGSGREVAYRDLQARLVGELLQFEFPKPQAGAIAAAAVGSDEDPVRTRILDSVSERRRDFIRMEMDALGEVRRRDAETAIGDFLGYLQLLEQKGELTIVRETEEYV